MSGHLEFGFNLGRQSDESAARTDREKPLRILILGNFSGDGGPAGGADSLDKPPVRINMDNFDQVMAHLAPACRLPPASDEGSEVSIRFGNLDDFHPDNLYRKLDLFQHLRSLRSRLADPGTFADAAAELRAESGQAPAAAASPAREEAPGEGEGDMMERLLGQRSRTTPAEEGITQLISDLVKPHLVAETDPSVGAYTASVDAAAGEQMRRILHLPKFQFLEASWRSLYWLVTELDSSEDEVQLFLLSISKGALSDEIRNAGETLADSRLYRLLAENNMDGNDDRPWGVLIGNYTFGPGPGDIALLYMMSILASQAGAPFIAGGKSDILGCPSFAQAPRSGDWTPLEEETARQWQALRGSAMARWIGLAMPRVLMRLPYGKDGEPIDSFSFEELAPKREHSRFLWANPAFAGALLLGQSFLDNGWQMQPGDRLAIGELPAYSYMEELEKKMLPCAEAYLSEQTMDVMLNRGVMPLVSYQNRNVVRWARFQSIADPLTGLSGPWGG